MQNDYKKNPDCIPEETSDDETSLNSVSDTDGHQVSWADTLKYYSQSEQEYSSPVKLGFFILILRGVMPRNVVLNKVVYFKSVVVLNTKIFF